MSEQKLIRILAEQELHKELGIALQRDNFVTCSHWEGKEQPAVSVWNALLDARMELATAQARVAELTARYITMEGEY